MFQISQHLLTVVVAGAEESPEKSVIMMGTDDHNGEDQRTIVTGLAMRMFLLNSGRDLKAASGGEKMV